MADSNTCKCKETNWMHEQLLLLAQLVNESKDIIKEKFGVGITPKTKGDTFLKGRFTTPNVSDLGASFSANTLCEILLEQKCRIDTLTIFKIFS